MPKKSNLVSINPEILKWARESLAISVEKAAETAKITPERYEKWERGDENEKPTIAKLRDLANFFKRSLAVFFLSEVPKDLPKPKDFRVLYEEDALELTKNSRLAIRKAQWYQSVAGDLINDLDYSGEFAKKFVINLDIPVQEAVNIIRKMSFDSQLSWKTNQIALRNWREYVESQGILVFQFNMPLEEMRGFSLIRKDYPSAIILNSTDTVNGRIFSLFHEFGHIVINQSGICCPKEIEFRDEKHDRVEKYCNEFSGNFLIPTGLLDKIGNEMKGDVDLNYIDTISRKSKVSHFVVLRRLYDVGKIDYISYREFYKILLKMIKKSKSKGGDFYKNIFAERGNKLVKLVVEAESANKISISKALDVIGIQTSHYEKIKDMIYERI